jgi:hypothetical protein
MSAARAPVVPVVSARRVSARDNDLLVVRCPFCGRDHVHGAGGKGSPRGSGDGHRMAHCSGADADDGYEIVEEAA